MQLYKNLTLASTNNINSHPCIGYNIKCFPSYQDRDGAVKPVEFDAMIEVAAAAPRRFGLAPSSKEMFKTDAERLAKRKEYFATMDVNNDGTISFDEWLDYAFNHIVGKVAGL